MGDESSGYQYLALMYRMHFMNRKVPGFMVTEPQGQHPSNWVDFYEKTTGVFGGHMKCDCQRNAGALTEATIKTVAQNRFYRSVIRSPERPLLPHMFKASSIQVWGDHKIHGRVSPDGTAKAQVLTTDEKPFLWEHDSMEAALIKFVGEMPHKPTHIILATGAWAHTGVMENLPKALKAANKITKNVFWKETPPRRSSLLNTKLDTFSRPMDIDNRALDLCNEGYCTYIPFPKLLPKRVLGKDGLPDYWDEETHPSDPLVYECWNVALLEALGLGTLHGAGQFGDDECKFFPKDLRARGVVRAGGGKK